MVRGEPRTQIQPEITSRSVIEETQLATGIRFHVHTLDTLTVAEELASRVGRQASCVDVLAQIARFDTDLRHIVPNAEIGELIRTQIAKKGEKPTTSDRRISVDLENAIRLAADIAADLATVRPIHLLEALTQQPEVENALKEKEGGLQALKDEFKLHKATYSIKAAAYVLTIGNISRSKRLEFLSKFQQAAEVLKDDTGKS